MLDLDGCHNLVADAIKRIDATWSDINLEAGRFEEAFIRLVCNECGSKTFEVLLTGDWETTARCTVCGQYFIVHTG